MFMELKQSKPSIFVQVIAFHFSIKDHSAHIETFVNLFKRAKRLFTI